MSCPYRVHVDFEYRYIPFDRMQVINKLDISLQAIYIYMLRFLVVKRLHQMHHRKRHYFICITPRANCMFCSQLRRRGRRRNTLVDLRSIACAFYVLLSYSVSTSSFKYSIKGAWCDSKSLFFCYGCCTSAFLSLSTRTYCGTWDLEVVYM